MHDVDTPNEAGLSAQYDEQRCAQESAQWDAQQRGDRARDVERGAREEDVPPSGWVS